MSETAVLPPSLTGGPLRESAERWGQLMALLPVAVYTISAPDGEITWYNEQAAALWGRRPAPGDTDERWCGSFRLRLPDGSPLPHDQTPMMLALAEGRSFRNLEVIIERPPPDSSLVTVLANIDPIRDAAGRVVGAINVFHDVTPRYQAERDLARTESQLETLLRTAPIGFAHFDRELRFLRINERLAEMNGLPVAAHLGRTVAELMPSLLPAVEEVTAQIVATGRAVVGHEVRGETLRQPGVARCWNESWYPMHDEAGAISGFGVVVEEITERRAAETMLRESEQRLAGLVDSAMDAVIVVDAKQRVVLFNPAAEQMFGCAVSEAIGESLGRFIPARFRDAHRQHVEKFGHTGVTNRRMGALGALNGLRTSGEEFPIEASISQTEAGGKKLFTVILRDITERKQVEAALVQAKEEAERANAAKDDFLAALSHELRTPLSPVLMLAGAAASDPALPEQLREDFQMIARNVQLEARLIDDLLDLTRISRGKIALNPVSTDLHALLRRTWEIVSGGLADAPPTLRWECMATAPWVMADPARLSQVFWNLLNNALKFTPASGAITLRTRESGPGRVCIDVADTGRGIPAEALEKIFRPFDQGTLDGSRHRYGGLGLGLAISRAIVELHHGTLHAASEGADRGATFSVELAMVAEPAAARSSERARARSASLRILLVEDHASTLEQLARLLRLHGHAVHPAATMAEALTLAAQHECDVLLSDLGLPDGTGHELMARLRAAHPGLRGIALSGYGMEDDVQRSHEAGFSAHLVKPIDFDQLRHALTEPLR